MEFMQIAKIAIGLFLTMGIMYVLIVVLAVSYAILEEERIAEENDRLRGT